jgi:serine/threonine protein kinase
MAVPATATEFLELVRKSGVVDEKRLEPHVQKLRAAGTLPEESAKLAGVLVRDGLLTHFQAEQIMQGKWRRFTIGKYKVLERLGSGGMGSVYLCEHKLMRRRVAVKVLPAAKASDQASLERFYREARAAAALDHPNIVHAYDIDQDEKLHFLVMEYVDGSSLQEIVKKSGPLDVTRAAHYIRDAALGLTHAHTAGLVHRDIKPGNILVDRSGVVKVLDMGLARFFNDEDDILTKKFDETVLGTADYLAPEQAVDSHGVDIRADIYSLGATFYFLLAGRTPFGEGTVTQKLLWHQSRKPKPLATHRADLPAELIAIIEKMMEKDPAARYQDPALVAEALAPWTQTPIAPPKDVEMPRLSLAATGVSPVEATLVTSGASPAMPSAAPQRSWPGTTPSPRQAVAPATPGPVTPGSQGTPAPVPYMEIPERSSSPTLATPTLTTPAPEEGAPWESLAADTEDPAARADTAPSSARRTLRMNQIRQQEQRRLRRIATVITVLAATALAVGFALWFTLRAPSGPQARRFSVSRAAGQGGFRTIARALSEAKSGDIIELEDEVHEENLVVDPNRGATAVTIQAAPGKEVVWKPLGKDDKARLLFLSKASGFVLKGSTGDSRLVLDGALDGKRRLKNLVFITSHCPGLTLEDVTFRNFGHSAVSLVNCSGEPKPTGAAPARRQAGPIRLINLRTSATGTEKPEAAVYFDADPSTNPSMNNHIEIIGGDFAGFDGPAVKLKDNTVNDRDVTWPGK